MLVATHGDEASRGEAASSHEVLLQVLPHWYMSRYLYVRALKQGLARQARHAIYEAVRLVEAWGMQQRELSLRPWS